MGNILNYFLKYFQPNQRKSAHEALDIGLLYTYN